MTEGVIEIKTIAMKHFRITFIVTVLMLSTSLGFAQTFTPDMENQFEGPSLILQLYSKKSAGDFKQIFSQVENGEINKVKADDDLEMELRNFQSVPQAVGQPIAGTEWQKMSKECQVLEKLVTAFKQEQASATQCRRVIERLYEEGVPDASVDLKLWLERADLQDIPQKGDNGTQRPGGR